MAAAQACHFICNHISQLGPGERLAQMPLPVARCTLAEAETAGDAYRLLGQYFGRYLPEIPEGRDVAIGTAGEVESSTGRQVVRTVEEREVLTTVGKGTEEACLRDTVGTGNEGGVGGCNLLGTQVLTLRRCLDEAGDGKQADGRQLEVWCYRVHNHSVKFRGEGSEERFMPLKKSLRAESYTGTI